MKNDKEILISFTAGVLDLLRDYAKTIDPKGWNEFLEKNIIDDTGTYRMSFHEKKRREEDEKRKKYLLQMTGTSLSIAETRVYDLLVEGYSNIEIAKLICVSEKTVRFHMTNIYYKYGLINKGKSSRATLIAQHFVKEKNHSNLLKRN